MAAGDHVHDVDPDVDVDSAAVKMRMLLDDANADCHGHHRGF
jgi:hypothetical protein